MKEPFSIIPKKQKKILNLISFSPRQLCIMSSFFDELEGVDVSHVELQDLIVPGHHGLLDRSVLGLLRGHADIQVLTHRSISWNFSVKKNT